MRSMLRVAVSVGAVVFAAVTTAVGVASGAPPDFLVADAIGGFTFILAGIVAWGMRPATPVGPALLACGVAWFVGSYAPTGQPALTHLGFAFEGYYDLILAALLLWLSDPAHRVRPRAPIVGLAAAFVVRSTSRLLLQDPVRLYPDCIGCPPNPFALFPDRVLFESIEAVTSLVIAVLTFVIAMIALRRLRSASGPVRHASGIGIAAGVVAMAAASWDALETAWSVTTGDQLLAVPDAWHSVVEWIAFFLRVLVPLGFLVATLRLRSEAGPLAPLATTLGAGTGPSSVGPALRAGLRDPRLRLIRPVHGGGWEAEDGTISTDLDIANGLVATMVGDPARPLAAVVHDPGLRDAPELFEPVLTMLRLTLENERLDRELEQQLELVSASRARIVRAAEEERRSLERDLHDGAQQRLVAVTLALQRARAVAAQPGAPTSLVEQLDATAAELAGAIDELRELARGIHPAILEDEGLPAAIAALGRRAALSVEIHADLGRRLPPLVESTAYFVTAEALTNAQRHAGATRVVVTVIEHDAQIRLDVADDGRGGADPTRGTGLRGLADRVAAIGGRLEVESHPTAGTTVRAWIPIA